VGPVRHRRLINLLSMAVALQLAVSLVVLATRAGRDIGPRSPAELSAKASQNGSILAGGTFTRRRGSKTPSGSAGTTATSAVTTAPAPPQTTATSAQPAVTTPPTGSPATTKPAPESTTTTSRPSGATRTTSGTAPTTTSAPAPAAATGAAAATPDAGRPGVLSDPDGDTFVDGSQKPVSESRADIVKAGAAYGPGGVTFAMQVKRPTDPRTDERWAADSTYAQWSVDTNGDSAPDFEVQYFFVDEENLGGSVSRPSQDGEPVCEATAVAYSDEAYLLTVDPACLGNPASFSFRATIFYDTNPADEDADVISDLAPNGGWSFPVGRPS
jgi:hypothetical protein